MRYLVIFLYLNLACSLHLFAGGNEPTARAIVVHHIQQYYPEQLTNPQKKNRNTLAQFGYNLSYFTVPIFPITSFVNPHHFGVHSYSQPGRGEKNGCLYTCRGGFIDFSHMRAAVDWTVYLAFKILSGTEKIELSPEAGTLKLSFHNLDELSDEDIVSMAQKIAFERLEWHEIASWHYHKPYHFRCDQQSTFTPEDTYSNFLGTVIGKNIALRILQHLEKKPFAEIATEEIEKKISSLEPVQRKKESKEAYDIVDRNKQLKLAEDVRNNDVWWDSKILFRDQRYVFKRYINIGPVVDPWLVPEAEQLGCDVNPVAEIFPVPANTEAGISMYDYYSFVIDPDTAMFYGKKNKQIHTSFSMFNTSEMAQVVKIISSEMETILMPGFDTRNNCDPTQYYQDLKFVGPHYTFFQQRH